MPVYRFLKQTLYSIFYATFFFAIVAGIYFVFLRNPASCFDGRKNQGEEEIDCGGPCEPCEIKKLVPLQVVTTRVFRSDSVTTLFAELRNPNSTFGAASFSYTWHLFDALGEPIETLSGESFIYPGEIKYFVEPLSDASLKKISQVDFAVATSSLKWKRKEEFSQLLMQFREVENSQNKDEITTQGVIVSGETLPFNVLRVGALYFDATGRLIGASKTELRDIRPFEERFFKIVYRTSLKADLAKTRLFFEGKRP
jgi:hypothetical protein